MKKIIGLICLGIMICISSFGGAVQIETLEAKRYIDLADEVSYGKAQVSWQAMVATLLVEHGEKIASLDSGVIKDRAEQFLVVGQGDYRVKELDAVMDELKFSKREKEKAKGYMGELSRHGIIPESLVWEGKQSRFIEQLIPGATEGYRQYGILPSVTIAQAILESSWGESVLAKEYNNLFGIKAGIAWDGETVILETREFYKEEEWGTFRKYEHFSDSLKDHGAFLATNQRYTQHGVFNARTYQQQAIALEEAGYSTAEDEEGNKVYAERLIQLIQQYNLQVVDSYVHQGESIM